jgi:hypothetical protein
MAAAGIVGERFSEASGVKRLASVVGFGHETRSFKRSSHENQMPVLQEHL